MVGIGALSIHTGLSTRIVSGDGRATLQWDCLNNSVRSVVWMVLEACGVAVMVVVVG